MGLDETFDNVLDVVNKIEKALYALYRVVTLPAYKNTVAQVPETLRTMIQETLKNTINEVSGVIQKFLLDADLMTQIKGVLGAALDVTQATMDLLPEAARTTAEKAERFMRAVMGLVTAGTNHMKAIIALISTVVTDLAGGTATLDAATITTLKTNPLLPDATA